MNFLQCLDRFTVLWILLDIVHSYNRDWIYCIFDIVHILEETVQLCKLSEYLFSDILCDWISKSSQDKNILCYRILNRSQDTDICVSRHQTDHRTDHRTDYWIQWTNFTVSYSGQVRLVSLLYHCLYY